MKVPGSYPRRKYGGSRAKYQLKRKRFRSRRKKMLLMKKSPKDAYYKGATIRQEYGSVVTDNYCAWVGHGIPTYQFRRNFFLALTKMILSKAGMNSITPTNVIPTQGGLPAGDSIYIYYRKGVNTGQPAAPFSKTYTFGANESMSNIATELMKKFEEDATMGAYEDLRFESIRYYPSAVGSDTQDMSVNLVGAKVSFYFESVMKIQNRTADGANNTQADDLVAQHVIGKSYFGYGSGSDIMVRSNNTLEQQAALYPFGNGAIGGTNFSAFVNSFGLSEPLPKNHVPRCITSNSIKFAPSELKKSKLVYRNVLPIDSYWKHVCRNYQVGIPTSFTQGTDHVYGKWRVFALEKEIETRFAEAPATPITLGIEVNNTTGCSILPVKQTFTTRENWIGTNLPNYA